MRFMGIDYGTKRVGIALSDESGTLAFAHSTIEALGALTVVQSLAQSEGVRAVVLGQSLNLDGTPNPVMRKIEAFKSGLEKAGLRVVYENERMTSAQAARNPAGESVREASPAKAVGKSAQLDAAAAALILQSYLDKLKK